MNNLYLEHHQTCSQTCCNRRSSESSHVINLWLPLRMGASIAISVCIFALIQLASCPDELVEVTAFPFPTLPSTMQPLPTKQPLPTLAPLGTPDLLSKMFSFPTWGPSDQVNRKTGGKLSIGCLMFLKNRVMSPMPRALSRFESG